MVGFQSLTSTSLSVTIYDTGYRWALFFLLCPHSLSSFYSSPTPLLLIWGLFVLTFLESHQKAFLHTRSTKSVTSFIWYVTGKYPYDVCSCTLWQVLWRKLYEESILLCRNNKYIILCEGSALLYSYSMYIILYEGSALFYSSIMDIIFF